MCEDGERALDFIGRWSGHVGLEHSTGTSNRNGRRFPNVWSDGDVVIVGAERQKVYHAVVGLILDDGKTREEVGRSKNPKRTSQRYARRQKVIWGGVLVIALGLHAHLSFGPGECMRRNGEHAIACIIGASEECEPISDRGTPGSIC